MLYHISLNSLTSIISTIIDSNSYKVQLVLIMNHSSCSVMIDTSISVAMYSKCISMYHVASHYERYVVMKL